jgi:hypothetical protein
MKYNIIFSVFLLAVFACNNTAKDDKSETIEENPITNTSESGEEGINTDPIVSTGNASSGSSSGKLNPPHGEPGHRCDIAVGAPLDSEPNKTLSIDNVPPPSPSNTITPAPSGNTTIGSSNTNSGSTPPGMNPPHGEPGHDCAIPVGAPLKKK